MKPIAVRLCGNISHICDVRSRFIGLEAQNWHIRQSAKREKKLRCEEEQRLTPTKCFTHHLTRIVARSVRRATSANSRRRADCSRWILQLSCNAWSLCPRAMCSWRLCLILHPAKDCFWQHQGRGSELDQKVLEARWPSCMQDACRQSASHESDMMSAPLDGILKAMTHYE